jgi:uncharacterized protein YciW
VEPMSEGEFRGRVLTSLDSLAQQVAALTQKMEAMADFGYRLNDLEQWRREEHQTRSRQAAQEADRRWRGRWEWTHTVVVVATAIMDAVVVWLVHH